MGYLFKFAEFELEGMKEVSVRQKWRVAEHRAARLQGSITPRVPAEDSRRISLVGEVWKANQPSLEEYLQQLRQALSKGRQRLTKLDYTDFYKNAVCESYEEVYRAERNPTLIVGLQMSFISEEPFWYAASDMTATANLTGISAPFAVTNNGRASTPPVFRVDRTSAGTEAANVSITNTSTSLNLQWLGSLEVGKPLIFDCKNGRVTYGGADAMNNFIPGQIFQKLEPGVNNFQYAGSGNVTVSTFWTQRWH